MQPNNNPTDLSQLNPHSPPLVRMSMLLNFIHSWFEVKISQPRQQEASNLPQVLQLFYSGLGSQVNDVFKQNKLLLPHELEVENGRRIFYVEKQGVYVCAFGDGDDPEVWQKLSHETNWKQASPRLSEFLIYATLLEALISAPCKARADEITVNQRKELLKELKPVQFPANDWLEGATYAVSNGLVACLGHTPDFSGAEIGGLNEKVMEFIWDIADDSWEIDV